MNFMTTSATDGVSDEIGSADVCEILAVSAASVNRWTKSGYLPTVRLSDGSGHGGHVYARTEVEELKRRRDAAKATLDWRMASC